VRKYNTKNHLLRLVQDVASKTNELAGDGTTTATVLARAIFTEGVKNVAAGCNPLDLRRGAQLAVDNVLEFLKTNSKVVTTSAEIAQVKYIGISRKKEKTLISHSC
jgi:chaperonin GroEL